MKKRCLSFAIVCCFMFTVLQNVFIVNVNAMGDYSGNITGATWYWPIHGYSSASSAYSRISSSYGYRGVSSDGTVYNRNHYGVDIGESRGTAVYPTRNGTVYLADNSTDGSEGRSIIINHGDGYYSAYYHLSSVNVSWGQSVDTNTQIGAVGGSGYNSETCYSSHLHFAIHYGSSWSYNCNVNPCPSGYTSVGSSFQASNGGHPEGSASISYLVSNSAPPEPVDPPSNCWINIYKGGESTYNTSETVKLTYHAENVNYYTVEIYKDGASFECFDTYSGEYNRTFAETGRYNAVVSAVNGGGRTYSGWISWNVVAVPAPTNCWISIDKGPESTYNISETVKLTYHAENVNYYTVEIYKDGASFECFDTYYGQYSKTMTAVGRYNAVISAVNSGGRTYSGWISWNVVDPSAVGPNVPYVAVSNRNVFPNEQFRINFWSETAKYYNVKIAKDGITYKDEYVYVGYYDTSLQNTGQYSIQITAINDYGSSVGYDGVYVIDSVPETPTITTQYECYGINEDIDIQLTCGKYTQTSYMTIRKLTTEWETVFSGSVTDVTKKTMSFPTAGYYQIEYQNSNIYGASPCAVKGLYIYDSVPEMPNISLGKSVYGISENIDISLNQGVNARTSYMSIFNSSSQVVFAGDVSGINNKTFAFEETGIYTIHYQSGNSLGQSQITVLTLLIGKEEMVVRFDANGGILETTEKTVFRDSSYGELPIPKCNGKTFIGWFTNKNDGEFIDSDTIVTALDDHTLYAVWKNQPSTKTTVIKKGNYSLVNIAISNLDENANVVLATYKNGILSDIQIEEYNGEDLSLATFLPYDTVKVMLWESMGSMMPLCGTEILH